MLGVVTRHITLSNRKQDFSFEDDIVEGNNQKPEHEKYQKIET